MKTNSAVIGVETDDNDSREALDTLNLDLRESEERYRTLFDLVPVAVYTIDSAGVIQTFNRRAAELWGREPALGDTDERFCGSYKLFRPDGTFMPHAQCPMAEVVTGKLSEVRDAEVIIERPDGSRITVVVNIRPHKNQRGEVIGAINCFYDITQRKLNEEALRLSDSPMNFGTRSLRSSSRSKFCVAPNSSTRSIRSALTGPTRHPSRQARTYTIVSTTP